MEIDSIRKHPDVIQRLKDQRIPPSSLSRNSKKKNIGGGRISFTSSDISNAHFYFLNKRI